MCTENFGSSCEKRCTRAGQRMYRCYSMGGGRNWFQLSSPCESGADGELSYTFDEGGEYCQSCEDGTCYINEAYKGLELVRNDSCDPTWFQQRCNPDPTFLNSTLLCNIAGTVIASNCPQKTDTCAMFPPKENPLPENLMGDPGCIMGTCTTEGEVKTIINKYSDECRYICTKALDGQLYFRDEGYCFGDF